MAETLIEFDGRLDASSVPAFLDRMAEASPVGTEKLLLDLSRVSFIGSAGLRAILVTAKRLVGVGWAAGGLRSTTGR